MLATVFHFSFTVFKFALLFILVSDSESCSVISKAKPNSLRWQRHTEFPTCLQMYTRTITLQHLTISLIIISVICLGVMTLVLIQPVRLNTPDLFQVTLLLVVPFSFQSFVWLLTPHTQMIATILALWQLHFIKVISQQSGKCFRSVLAKTERLRRRFYPQAIRLLNSVSYHL